MAFNDYRNIFKPLKVGHTTFRNRFEFSPMVNNFVNSLGEPTQNFIDFIESQAESGVSILTIGASPVDKLAAVDFASELDVTTDEKLCGLLLIAEAAHRHGAKVSVELVHAGRGADPDLIKLPYVLAPSNIPVPGRSQYIKEIDQKDIEQIIASYCDCAKRLQRCQFDAVLVHAAHGNLLTQFLSPLTNRRNDIYGGSFENRCRFPLMLLKALRGAVGPNFLIEMRVSGDEMVPGGMHIEETIEFIKLAQEYIDWVNISAGQIVDHSAQFFCMPPYYREKGANVPLARAVKQNPDIHIPVSVVGGIVSADMAEKIIAEGSADMVAMARALLCDLEMLKKSYRGKPEDVRPCLRCFGCSSGGIPGGHINCAVNPSLGRTAAYRKVVPAFEKKKIAVVGGGVSGSQAAITLRKRGHEVIVFEKSSSLGGKLNDINKLPFKDDLLRHTEWLIRTAMSCGADIRLNTEATPEIIAAVKPDAVIVAAGSSPLRVPIPGIDGKNVFNVLDVDAGRKKVNGRVVVCGGGASGCESGLALAMEGCSVTIVDQIPKGSFAGGMARTTRNMLLYLLSENKVELVGSSVVRSIDETGVTVEGSDWKYRKLEADFVVDALGMRSNSEIAEEFKTLMPDVYVVGDCSEVKNIKYANLTAYDLCCNI